MVDDLTGVANRRRFFEVTDRDLAAAQLHDWPMYVMMIDINHVNRADDEYGHPVGDEVIRAVARRLRNRRALTLKWSVASSCALYRVTRSRAS